jgi:TRAP-type mannitol/chloroaromatic compound transport system permease small subunit
LLPLPGAAPGRALLVGERIVNALIASVRFIDRINRVLGNLFVSWILFLIMGVALFEVVTRRIIGNPQAWTQEILAYLFCAHFVLALGYTLHYKEHVVVDAVTNLFSEQVQVLLETAVYLFFVGIFLYVMLPTAYDFMIRSWTFGERAPTAFNSPVYPAKTLIPISLVLLGIQLAAIVMKNAIFLTTGRRVEG